MNAIVKRFKEPSTWAGLSGLMLLVGMNVEQATAITQLGAALTSALAVFMGERNA